MPSESDSVKLARIDQRTINTDRNLAEHVRNDDERFTRMFTYLDKKFTEMHDDIGKQFNNVGKQIEEMGITVRELWDEKKERDGASKSASRLVAAGGYSLNIIIAALTAWATYELIGK